jgi:lipopolysaccharide/colanic/teichoic acid biosynthesis glycosyltransferase
MPVNGSCPASGGAEVLDSGGMPRAMEGAIALALLVIAFPFIAVSALAIVLSSGWPVIFTQPRVGQNGRTFTLYKLRTMRRSKDGLEITAHDDCRLTAVGKVLRNTKIDELPELWNVVNGDMSLVGPRPEVPRYVDMENALWRRVLKVKPGITDPVTLRLRNEQRLIAGVDGDREQFYLKVLQPYKLAGYISFLQERSWWLDVKILWKTCIAVCFPASAPPPTLNEIGFIK